jgi:CelD/BcsL family acetyltransferase involved in cellulose biosynthesis
MKVSVVTSSDLGPRDHAAWLEIQQRNPLLASPYFCPEFTDAVGSVRDDVRVAVLEDGGTVVGYFPFQRARLGAGRPVGGRLSDYHGVVAAPETNFDFSELLRESDLAFWQFDHLVAGQAPLARYHRRRTVSPALDLSRGFTAYRQSRIDSGSNRIAQLERKQRRLARELGPVRFEEHVSDAGVLERVFALKSEQCLRTGVPDFFSLPWTRGLVERILTTQREHFAGMLSALYAGDQLVAAHMGMRSQRVCHWWFPVYDRALARYSPGAILLLRLAEATAARGLPLLDLGKGNDAYKSSFSDHNTPLAEGCAFRPSLGAFLHRTREDVVRRARASALVTPVRPALRKLMAWVRRRSFA